LNGHRPALRGAAHADYHSPGQASARPTHYFTGQLQTMSRYSRLALLPLAFLSAHLTPLTAQMVSPATRVAQAVNGGVMRAHLEFLADDALEGRGTATRGGELAAKYIATEFKRLGLEPAGDSGRYFQRVPIIALTPEPTLSVTTPTITSLAYRDDYVLWSMRDEPAVQTHAPAVFVGYGIVAPEYQWDDYRGVDVKGKIVICLVNDPGLRDSTIFKGRVLTYYGRWTYKIEEAARHGAAGILMVHSTESATYPWTTVASSWTGEQVRLERPATSLVVAGWIKDTVATALLKTAGADLPALILQAAKHGFAPVPLQLEFDASVKSAVRRSATANVVGLLPGRGLHATEAVLIGGHYDHFGIRQPVNGDSIYNGAEDNASGTAAVLTLAEAFASSKVKPGRSILFVAFGAEESGLLGSQAFAETPPWPLKSLAAVLNLDIMNLYGRTRDVAALGVEQSSLGRIFREAAAAEGLKVVVNEDALIRGSFFRSDHFPLAKAGVPALSLENGLDFVGRPAGWGDQQRREYTDKRYHQPQDEVLPWFTMVGAVQQMRVVARTAVVVGSGSSQPEWAAGSEFRAAGEARLK
jgi:Zn-dependent M28 family amino/carboxypeptidase